MIHSKIKLFKVSKVQNYKKKEWIGALTDLTYNFNFFTILTLDQGQIVRSSPSKYDPYRIYDPEQTLIQNVWTKRPNKTYFMKVKSIWKNFIDHSK